MILVGIFQRSFAADFGICARAQTVGQLDTELDLYRRIGKLQRLQSAVGNDKLHALQVRGNLRWTALPPPPPTPMTLILALFQQFFR